MKPQETLPLEPQSQALTTPEPEKVMTTPLPTTILFSPTIGKLASALAKAQGDFDRATKETSNPFFKSKYADLATVIEASRKALSDNELAVIQSPQVDDTRKLVVITTILAHSSGEWMSGELAIPVSGTKWDAQVVGSAITYGRRYSLQSFLAIPSVDDDGNLASGRKKGQESDEEYDKRTEGQRTIDDNDQRAFWAACKKSQKTNEQVADYLATLGLKKTDQIMRKDFDAAIKWALKSPDAPDQTKFRALFAAAKEHNVPEADLRTWIKDKWGFEHLSQMSGPQMSELMSWVKEQV